MKIRVVKKTFKSKSKSKTRRMTFGDKCWFLSVFEMKKRTYEKIKEQVEKITSAISKKENIKEENIEFIRWGSTTKFGKQVKPGDQLIFRCSNDNRSQSSVYSVSPILAIEKEGKFVQIYHDVTNCKKVSFTNFKRKMKRLELEKLLSGSRTMVISRGDEKKLKVLWKSNSYN